jgi:predicted XRE-type DNA-binding protein
MGERIMAVRKVIVGIGSHEDIKKRAVAIARGERRRSPGEPTIWFTSLENPMGKVDAIEIERGSGNVFADLGRPDAETHLLKAKLVTQIDGIIRSRRLTQAKAAEVMGLSQPDVSRLLKGQFKDYSVERLLRLLLVLGRDVDIVVRKQRSHRPGRLTVEAA